MAKFITLREFKEALAKDERPSAAVRKQVATEAKQLDREELTIDFVISTAAPDRENDTIAVGGWDIAAFLSNPVVLWAHDHSAPPVAQALSLSVTEDALLARAKFTPREISPFGFMIFQMYAERFLRATSVGFIPLDWTWRQSEEDGFGIDFTRQELLEFSCVPVPANPEALALARGKGIDLKPLKAWAEDVLDAWDDRKAEVALPRKKVEGLRREVLELVGPISLTLGEQVALGKINLERLAHQDTVGAAGTLVLEEDNSDVDVLGKDQQIVGDRREGYNERVELGALESTARERALKDLALDTATFMGNICDRFDTLEVRTLEIGNALAKLSSRDRLDDQVRNLNKMADARAEATREEFAGAFGRLVADVKSIAEEARSLRSGIELNVERKLLDFETSIETKFAAALETHLTDARTVSEAVNAALLDGIEAQAKQQLDAALDRFKDYYSGRMADYEARAEQRADRVNARLQDVQQILLRAVSKLDQAVKGDQTSEGMQQLGEQLSLFGESLRELVDALSKLGELEEVDNDVTIEMADAEDGDTVELDLSNEELTDGVRTAVSASFKGLVSGEVARRLNQIRGRLD